MSKLIKSFLHDSDGATAIEYALIAGLLSVVIIGGVTLLGARLSGRYESTANAIP